MRICYFGTYRAGYTRNRTLITGLRRAGVDVIECHETLWQGIEDRVATASGGWFSVSFILRVMRVYARLIAKYFRVGDYDIMVVGYPGHFDVFLARLLTWIKRKPLVWDVFMSLYLVSLERQLNHKSSITARLLWVIEYFGLKLPDLLLQITEPYKAWFIETFKVRPEKNHVLSIAADTDRFKPSEYLPRQSNKLFVVFYGSFVAAHGINIILEAAKLLESEDQFQFHLIGTGPDVTKVHEFMQNNDLNNMTIFGHLDDLELIEHLSKADVLLGSFGSTVQGNITVQNKIFESLALKKPVITGQSIAIDLVFRHNAHLITCERSNPNALAAAIVKLYNSPDLCERISQAGYQEIQTKYSIESIAKTLVKIIEERFPGAVH